MLLFLAQ